MNFKADPTIIFIITIWLHTLSHSYSYQGFDYQQTWQRLTQYRRVCMQELSQYINM